MRKYVLICFCCLANAAMAQSGQPDINFGSVKPEDFSPSVYAIDSIAEAVYLFDVGSAYYHEDEENHIEMIHQRHTRIRILNTNAFALATLSLSLDNTADSRETLTSLDAAVYNLKEGKLVSEQIDKKLVFTEKTKQETKVKFTLPDVSVGSIIEYSYVIKTPGIDLPSWNFQGHYPRLWSRYEVVIPYFFNFAVLKQGNLSFVVDSTSTFHTNYAYRSYYRPNEDNTLQHTWVMKNVAGIAPEPFNNTIDNYTAKVEFQLSAYANLYGEYTPVNQSWASVCMKLMSNPAFSFADEKERKNMAILAKVICGQDTSELEKAEYIYKYIRDNYTCIFHYGKLRSQEIKATIQSKKGVLADINLLLYGLLEEAGLTAHPVLLSTNDHGKINYEYPTLSRYNYVICQLIVGKKQYLLDAAYKYLPFGPLNDNCYNGYSRVINMPESKSIFISPNSLDDSICTEIKISGSGAAQVTTNLSTQPSVELKAVYIGGDDKKNAELLKNSLYNEAPITDVKAKGFLDADSNVSFSYKIPVENMEADVIYFSPLLSLQMKSNPFASATRLHDVEMPFCRKDVFHVSMEIPDGYEIEEMPKSEQIKAENILGEFTYTAATENNNVQLDVQSKLGKAIYQPEDYPALRKFYSDVLAKEAEQIVLKKKK